MSHAHSAIELADGLTALVGPNNCGKSAVVDAIQTVCENARGSYMLRHGQKECGVTIETAEGHVVEWRRKGDTVKYLVDGREFDRLSGGVPQEVHAILKLPKVPGTGDSDGFQVHIAG